eukprot:GHVP01021115.1.p1 GENE.GHVP01021115.1~~GHVP01021115.1.p1  ORF type:complete len:398 (-),score=57.49 GHVP01021115.1:96-1289(-)
MKLMHVRASKCIQFQETHAFWPELCICKTCHTKSQLCFSCERPLLSLACRDAMRLHNWMNLGPLSRYKNMRYESAVESSLAGVCRDCFSIGIVASDAEALIVTWEALLFMEKELGLKFRKEILKAQPQLDILSIVEHTSSLANSYPPPTRPEVPANVPQVGRSTLPASFDKLSESIELEAPPRKRPALSRNTIGLGLSKVNRYSKFATLEHKREQTLQPVEVQTWGRFFANEQWLEIVPEALKRIAVKAEDCHDIQPKKDAPKGHLWAVGRCDVKIHRKNGVETKSVERISVLRVALPRFQSHLVHELLHAFVLLSGLRLKSDVEETLANVASLLLLTKRAKSLDLSSMFIAPYKDYEMCRFVERKIRAVEEPLKLRNILRHCKTRGFMQTLLKNSL